MRPRSYLFIPICALALSGCVEYQAARSAVTEVGQTVTDQALNGAILAICDLPTAGALRRKWGGDKEGAEVWKAFCDLNRKSVAP